MGAEMFTEGYVVVVNKHYPATLRHIVEIKVSRSRDEFIAWYYGEYHKLDGDEFVYCPTRADMENYIKTFKEWKNRSETMHTIHQLRGEALEKALRETKEADFKDEVVTREDLIAYNERTGAVYSETGEFLDYCPELYQ